jgi:hypothetical protein
MAEDLKVRVRVCSAPGSCDPDPVSITKITAIPEKRLPLQGNNSSYFLLEAYQVGTNNLLWSSASYSASNRLTNSSGVWTGNYQVTSGAGNYDLYFTGLSHLKRKLANVTLTDSPNQLEFTAPENQAPYLAITNPQYSLFAGDVAMLVDPDGSCGGAQNICLAYSGDEWGDNYINGLDMSAAAGRLLVADPARIVKEDLNRDGLVNGLDMSIAQSNLLRWGDR